MSPRMPVSSSISRTAACSGVSSFSRWPFGQAPLDPARPVDPRDHGADRPQPAAVDDQTARGGLLDRRQRPPWGAVPVRTGHVVTVRRARAAGRTSEHPPAPPATWERPGRTDAARAASGTLDPCAAVHRTSCSRRRRRRADDLRISDLVEQAQRRAVTQMVAAAPTSSTISGSGSRRPGTSWRSSAARCATRCSAGRSPTSTSRPTPGPTRRVRLLRAWGDAHWEIGREFGTIGARRGDVVVEVTTYRSDEYDPASRKPEVRVRRHARGRPVAPRLHGERDGRAAAGHDVRRPARRPARPGRPGAADAGHPRGVVRRRPAADDARRPVRRPARVHRRARGASRR